MGRGDLIAAGVLAAGAAGVMSDAWRDIYRLGSGNEELSYVLLAPVMIACVAWVRRRSLETCRVRGGWTGLAILARLAFVMSLLAGMLIWAPPDFAPNWAAFKKGRRLLAAKPQGP